MGSQDLRGTETLTILRFRGTQSDFALRRFSVGISFEPRVFIKKECSRFRLHHKDGVGNGLRSMLVTPVWDPPRTPHPSDFTKKNH